MGAWVPVANQGGAVVLEAQGAIAAGDPVKLVTNGINVAGDGDTVFGVAASAIASGARGVVWTQGIFSVSFGASIVMGAPVYAAASGAVDAGSATNIVAGYVVGADATSGSRGDVMLTGGGLQQAAHA